MKTPSEKSSGDKPPQFDRDRHIRYFAKSLQQLDAPYAALDTNRLTMVHFAVHALDLLGVWDDMDATSLEKFNLPHPQKIIDWIYDCCCLPGDGGFQGGTYVGPAGSLHSESICMEQGTTVSSTQNNYRRPHIAMMYCALLTLHVLGDDGSRLPSKNDILQHVQSLQQADGSFSCVDYPSESDLRFLYCACVVCWIINDWSGMNQDKAEEFIRNCQGYDGGIALVPGQEGHGGSTFCGTAALVLLGRLKLHASTSSSTRSFEEDLIHWCVHRQIEGMQGRPNKLEDTCYSYWIGGTLQLLGMHELLDDGSLRNFILTCQAPCHLGGFSKVAGSYPDVLHSYYSLAWLSLSGQISGLHPLNATLGIRQDRVAGLRNLFSHN